MRFFTQHLEAFARQPPSRNPATRENPLSVFHETDLADILKWQEVLDINEVGVDAVLTYRLELNSQQKNWGRVVEVPKAVVGYLTERFGSAPIDLKWPLILGALFRPDEFLPDGNPLKHKPIVVGEALRHIERKPEEGRYYPLERHVTDYCFEIGVLPYEPVIQHTVRSHMPGVVLASLPQLAAAG